MKNLVQVQKALGDRLGREVFMYSITLDPEHDTPAVLKKYAKQYEVKSGWTFLTGKTEDIEKLRRKFGLVDSDPKRDADRTQHAGVIVIGNDAFNRWSSVPILAKPERIIQMIARMKPHTPSQKKT
jgi:protein SCO1/2